MDLENIPNKMQRGVKRADRNCDIGVDNTSHTATATQIQTDRRTRWEAAPNTQK